MTDSTRPHPDASTAAPAEKAGLWEDFVDILYAPSVVFARREHGSVLVPMAVVALLIAIITLASLDGMSLMLEGETRRAMAADPRAAQIPAEQLQTVTRMQGIFAVGGTIVGIPITMLVVGMVLWLAGKLVDARQTLHAALVVAAYAFVPRVLESVLTAVQTRVLDPALLDGMYRVRLSPARFFDPDVASPVLITLLGRLDVFVIWVTVLLAIGLAVTGRISRSRAAVAAAIVWIAGTLIPLFGALRQG